MRESSTFPRITIVVPSYNQAAFIRETLQSLVDQQYENLEVIVQDGGSTDGAIEIAQEFVDRFPDIFSLQVQRDRGHAHAVNMAFARSTGEILGYLNTDDTLYPGCLHQVAREIDPARGRYIVFGRSLFTGEGSPYVGSEHPAEYRGHFDLLAIWKRGYNTIPQPSTFWHRTVYETCGGFDEANNHGLDYLQWCLFSRRFRFHKVDALWSTYRMHPASVSGGKTEQQWLDIMIRYSRMHWGPWWHPLRWRCAFSLWLHHIPPVAHQHALEASEASGTRRYGVALFHTLAAAIRAPRLAHYWLSRHIPGLSRNSQANSDGFAGRYADNWIGPLYRDRVSVPADATRLVLILEHNPQGHHRHVSPTLWIDGAVQTRREVVEASRFSLEVDLAPYRGRCCALELRTSEFFIPRFVGGHPDDRPLSLLLLEQRVE